MRGPNADELLVSYSGTSGTLGPVWWINDPQGSPIAVAQADGTTGGIWTYDEYGQRGPNNGLRTQYTGQLWLPDFGVYHYKARAYHPGLGRFLQTDPVGYEAGMNLYAYVANDPVNLTDPDGRQTVPGTSGMTLEDWQRAGQAIAGDTRAVVLRAGETIQGPGARAAIDRNVVNIEISSARHGIDPNLQRGIIFEEQSHQLPPGEGLLERAGLGRTIGLGQVTEGTGGYTREQLFDSATNIEASAELLGSIARQPLIDPARPDASIATRYNCGSCEAITPYGTRVERYTEEFRNRETPW